MDYLLIYIKYYYSLYSMVLPQARYGEVPVYHFIAPQGAEAKADAKIGAKGKLSAFFLYNHEEYVYY